MEWFLLIFLSLLWGGSFFFGQVALVELPPLTLVLARTGIAAVVLGVLLRTGGGRPWLALTRYLTTKSTSVRIDDQTGP